MREQYIEYRDGDALLKGFFCTTSEECAALMNPFMNDRRLRPHGTESARPGTHAAWL